jgi:uncharacterized damage-inducible protein DinB
MTEEQQRIRSYLTAQGAKLSPAELVDKVRAAMDELHAALDTIPADRFADRPGADEWSGNEVMAHVVTTGALFARGIIRALDGAAAGPPVADVLERGVPEKSAGEWWQELVRNRSELFERALAADPQAHLDRTVEHRMFGALNWRETILFLRLHDLDHAGQLKKIADALGARS